MSLWYAVLCKPRREVVAEANLINQGYRVYLPRLATQCRRAGKWTDSVEPLFPRYLFVSPSDERQSLAPVRSTLGVSELVKFGGQPATVAETVLNSLRGQHDPVTGACLSRDVFKPDAPVKFRAGPFIGLEGVFAAETAGASVFVLLDFLGKTNKVKVFRDWLEPVHAHQ